MSPRRDHESGLVATVGSPQHWEEDIRKATWTILFAAVGAFIAWQLLRCVLPALIVVAVLLCVYRVVLTGRHRGGW
jgi:hypothetical protein